MVNCEKVPYKDKGCHAIVGFLIGAVSAFFYQGILVIVPMLLAGLGKEMYDEFIKKTSFDFMDFLATTIGGVVGILLVLTMLRYG